jgi:hypothetical protein
VLAFCARAETVSKAIAATVATISLIIDALLSADDPRSSLIVQNHRP